MCGICGLINTDRSPIQGEALHAMAGVLTHRGPDEEGYLLEGHIGLGSKRLSVIDPEGGTQPIYNEDRSLAVVCNGEIYNYREIRRRLEDGGHTFSTRSDTEVLVHLYEDHGEGCLGFLNGMFAFALWDRQNDTLFLARDRLGIKPLYYY